MAESERINIRLSHDAALYEEWSEHKEEFDTTSEAARAAMREGLVNKTEDGQEDQVQEWLFDFTSSMATVAIVVALAPVVGLLEIAAALVLGFSLLLVAIVALGFAYIREEKDEG